MAIAIQRWLNLLPPQLRPRGIRYHGASATQTATLHNRRIFVLPTKQGLVFISLLAVMLLGATNYSNNMAFVLAFWLGGLALISLLYTYRNLVGLQVRLANSEPCFAGGHANFYVALINSRQDARFDIEVSTQDIHNAVHIEAESYSETTLAIPTQKRGRLSLGRLTLATRYPLGLFRAWAYVDMEAEVLVYPKPSEQAPLPPQGVHEGERQQTPEPGSDDFHGFRNYQPGDAPHHINWKALAREQGLVTKQFQRHQSPELWLDWQTTGATNIEERLSRLCRWVLDAEQRQQNYGLVLPGMEISPSQGETQRKRCLAQLALFGETP